MARILSIDAGTTGVKSLVVDENGAVLGAAYREFPQSFPRPGWVEHDPDDWWTATLASSEEVLTATGTEPSAVTAVGITNQRETTVIWERESFRPIYPAIVWQDRRTAPLCDTLRDEGWTERIRDRTGLVIDPYFSGTKVAWLLENVADARKEASTGSLAYGTVDSYLLARLTGGTVHGTEWTNASRSLLFDIHKLDWDQEILERLDIPPALLPSVGPSSGRFGTTDPDAFLGVQAPVSGMAGDQQAALFGQACFEPGAAKNTYGTGSFVLMHTGVRPPRASSRVIGTMACGLGDAPAYALEGSIFVTGAAIQWLRDGVHIIERSDQTGPVAESVPDTGGVYFVPGLTGLGAPWWDAYARGTIVGITRGTTGAHLVRAAVEAMAYQTRDVVEAMREESDAPFTELRVDGGASVMDVLLQFQADLLGVPVRRPANQETTALGAAYLAGLAEGVWNGLDEIAALWHEDRTFEPRDTDRADHHYGHWRRAVERSLGWISG
ncbi:MAG: glycerol kinase GlpK [Actinomycetota bacterium]|nr:glycerol kinase GlpK [Actinomycetota bacterium]